MLDVEALLRPCYDALRLRRRRPVALRRPHARRLQRSRRLQAGRERAAGGARDRATRARVVFPMHEPDDGYTAANDHVIEAAAASGGRLVAFCRVNPHAARARGGPPRAWTPGRVGIKLHPRAEQFTLHTPGGARHHRARARARAAGPDPRRPRHPRARPRHGQALRGVPRRAADPRALRDLRPRLAVARAARPPERPDRHGVVGAGGPHRRLHARARRRTSCGRATRPTGCRWPPR